MNKVNDILEYFNFEPDKGLFLIHVLCNCAFSYYIYTSLLGGQVQFPQELTIQFVFEFFSSFQFIIPIVLYLVTRLIFSMIFPIVIGFIPRSIFEWWYQKKFHKNLSISIQKAEKNDAVEILAGLNKLRERLGSSKLTLTEAKDQIFSEEAKEEREERYYSRMMTLTVTFQLFYLYLIQTNTSFQSKWIGAFLLVTFILIYVRLGFTIALNRFLDVVRVILEERSANIDA